MFRALYAVRPTLDFNESGSKIKASPDAGVNNPLIITRTTPMTERAVILVPLICTGMDPQVVDTFLICIELCIFYYSVLDIE
jgi:hypothetical protein